MNIKPIIKGKRPKMGINLSFCARIQKLYSLTQNGLFVLSTLSFISYHYYLRLKLKFYISRFSYFSYVLTFSIEKFKGSKGSFIHVHHHLQVDMSHPMLNRPNPNQYKCVFISKCFQASRFYRCRKLKNKPFGLPMQDANFGYEYKTHHERKET